MKRFSWLGGLAAGLVLAFAGTVYAGRSGGTFTFTAPAGSVTSGTPITSAWGNAFVSQTAQALTDSLDRNGSGGMLAPLKVPDGSASGPGMTFTSETGSGLFRAGPSDVRMSVAGTAKQSWTTAGSSVMGTFGVSGATTLSSTLGVSGATTLSTLGVAGATTLSSTLGVTGATTLAATSASSLGVSGWTQLSGAVNTGVLTNVGDVTSYRPGAPNTGVVFLNQAANEYVFYDGARYQHGATGKPVQVGAPVLGTDAATANYVNTQTAAVVAPANAQGTGAARVSTVGSSLAGGNTVGFTTSFANQVVIFAAHGGCSVATAATLDGGSTVVTSGTSTAAVLVMVSVPVAGAHTLTCYNSSAPGCGLCMTW